MSQPGRESTVGATSIMKVPGQGSLKVRRFQVTVVEGEKKGMVWESAGDRCAIGSQAGNDLVLADPTVSRYHAEVRVDTEGARIIDLDSSNGTVVDGVRVREGYLRTGSLIRLGAAAVSFDFVGK